MRTKIPKNCANCGKEFMVPPSEIRRGGGRFCSAKCWYGSKNKPNAKRRVEWAKKTCVVCGKEYEIPPVYERRGNNKTCSDKCRGIWARGANNPNFRNASRNVVCALCGKHFIVGRHRLKDGRGTYCSMSCRGIASVLKCKKKGTSIEIKIENELISRGVVFQKQYPMWQAKTIPDFFIPPNICVYCDGDYWHNRPGMPEKDAQQNFVLGFLGYKVYRFWEHEINKSPKVCVDKIKEIAKGSI